MTKQFVMKNKFANCSALIALVVQPDSLSRCSRVFRVAEKLYDKIPKNPMYQQRTSPCVLPQFKFPEISNASIVCGAVFVLIKNDLFIFARNEPKL